MEDYIIIEKTESVPMYNIIARDNNNKRKTVIIVYQLENFNHD